MLYATLRLWAVAHLALVCYSRSTAEDPASLLEVPRDTVVELNTKVSFFCRGGGNPLPTIVWKRNGRPLTQNRYVVEMSHKTGYSTLRIEPVRERDNQSEFSCTADNGKGPPKTAQARLTVLMPEFLPAGFPIVTEDPKLKAAETGRPATMSCQVDGDPMPHVLWLKNLLPVDMTNKRYSISNLGIPGSLSINNSENEDQGKYECVARNGKGVSHSKSAQLYVKDRRVPPHFSILPRKKYNVMPGGRVNITCAAVGHPMPKVFWRKASDDDLDADSEAAPVGKNILNLTNVVRSENYTCVAFSRLGRIESVSSVEVRSLPDPPKDLKIHNSTSNSMVLLWTPSVASAHDEPIKHYIVRYRPKYTESVDYMETKPVTDPRATVLGLKPYTQYEFSVIGVTELGRTEPSRPAEAISGEALPSSPPKNVQSRVLSGNKGIHVTWEPPDKPNGPIHNYTVYYTTRETDPYSLWSRMITKEKIININNIQQKVEYVIQVTARNSIGFSPMSEKSRVITQPGVPGQPTNLKATPLNGERILLTWEPPLYSLEDITEYVVVYNVTENGRSTSSELTMAANNLARPQTTLEHLRPNTNYTIHVIGVSVRGRGVASSSIIISTSPAVPSGAPESVVVEAMSSRSLQVSWEPPPKANQNGLIIKYKIAWEPASGDEDDGDPGEEVLDVSPNSLRIFVIENLVPYTEYKVTVSAGTEVGFGPPCVPYISRTMDDVPGPPRNLHVRLDGVDNSSVFLSWEPPLEKNGHLVGYNIFVEESENGRVKIAGSRMPKYRPTAEFTSHTFHDLLPNTEYSFQISAYNRRGDGQLTRAATIKTPPRKPNEPQSFVVELATPMSDGPNKLVDVKLNWLPPINVSAASLNGYVIRYKWLDDNKADSYIQFTSQSTNATVRDLKLGRAYEFLVAARNDYGTGKEARNVIRTPDGTPTAPPSNVLCLWQSKNASLTCSWLPPPIDNCNGDIIDYMAWLTPGDGSNKTSSTLGLPRISYNVRLNETLQFSVRAKTSKGYGPWSKPITYGMRNPYTYISVKSQSIRQSLKKANAQTTQMRHR